MKIRSGFVSNSSSSSFIIWGFSTGDSCKVYDMLKKKFEEENPYLSDEDIYWKIQCYLDRRGIGYCCREDWYDTKEIGCILEEGSRKKFDESLKKAEDTLKKFNEEHHTDFSKNHKIYSAFELSR